MRVRTRQSENARLLARSPGSAPTGQATPPPRNRNHTPAGADVNHKIELTDKGITRIVGDSAEVMRALPRASFDTILTDPPYAMPATLYPTTMKGVGGAPSRSFSDALIMQNWWKSVCELMFPLLKKGGCIFVFCNIVSAVAFVPGLYRHTSSIQSLVWNKKSPALGFPFRRQHEIILYGTTGKLCNQPDQRRDCGDVIQCARVPSARRVHPAQKPHELLVTLLQNSTPRGGNVLDPFAGSGAVGFAAAQLGLTATCIEADADLSPAVWR